MNRALAILLCVSNSGCGLGYASALGFRARQAVLQKNIEAFPDLMEEAAETRPQGPLDNPKRTVLTHFLDLAAMPQYFPMIDAWKASGWIADDMVCSIYRAHAREAWESDPKGARGSAEQCLSIAREAAKDAEKSWQVKDCLEEASFLTQSSTASLVPYLERATDPTEPIKFRVALIDGMTRIPVTGPDRRQAGDATLTRERAIAEAEAQLKTVERRFEWIVAAAKTLMETTVLASGSAVGAMEIEEASFSLGRSYVGRYARSELPEEVDLAWAWVRAMKARKKNPTLLALGIWDRSKEPKKVDAYWYACTRASEAKQSNALGPMNVIEAITLRAADTSRSLEKIKNENCIDPKTKQPYTGVVGPFPLESVARGWIAGENSKMMPGRTVVTLKRRIVLDAAPTQEPASETPEEENES